MERKKATEVKCSVAILEILMIDTIEKEMNEKSGKGGKEEKGGGLICICQ